MTSAFTDLSGRTVDLLRKVRSKGFGGSYRAVVRRIPPWEERIRDLYCEWRLGISTDGEIPGPALGHRDPDCHHYGPSYYGSVHRILKAVPFRDGSDVFIDFGSGKGRVLVVASGYPFRRVIGVECAQQLTDVAWQNVERARRWMRCPDIEIVTADAASYDVPDDATVLYFQNPFSGHVVDAVLERIKTSLNRAPRQIFLISHSHDPAYRFEQQVRTCPWLQLWAEVRLQRGTRAWIYTNARWSAAPAGA